MALSIPSFLPAQAAAIVPCLQEPLLKDQSTEGTLADFLWSKVVKVDEVFSRMVSFPPGANAEKTELQECLGTNLPVVYQITQKGVEVSDPNMLSAAHQLYGPFFQQCFEDETYNKLRSEHDKAQAHHEKEVKAMESKLAKCEQDNPGKSCYKDKEISRRPALERVKMEDQSGREWKTLPGYLCYTININRPWMLDKTYDKGGYNCDLSTNKPTV